MVQNSGALHEPSVDEILMSIREIIEENSSVRSDHLSNGGTVKESAAISGFIDNSESLEEGVYKMDLSIDDAMKALADRIGLSPESTVSSAKPTKDDTRTEVNTVSGSMTQKTASSSGENNSVYETKRRESEVLSSQKEGIVSEADRLKLSAYCVASAEKIAEDVLRPVIAEWLRYQLPSMLKKILREEIVKAIKSK